MEEQKQAAYEAQAWERVARYSIGNDAAAAWRECAEWRCAAGDGAGYLEALAVAQTFVS